MADEKLWLKDSGLYEYLTSKTRQVLDQKPHNPVQYFRSIVQDNELEVKRGQFDPVHGSQIANLLVFEKHLRAFDLPVEQLFLSVLELIQSRKLSQARFFGKVGPYFAVETQQKRFYVTTQIQGKWTLLPQSEPVNLRKEFTGNLKSEIAEGIVEEAYLSARLQKLSQETVLYPESFYQVEDGKLVYNEDFEWNDRWVQLTKGELVQPMPEDWKNSSPPYKDARNLIPLEYRTRLLSSTKWPGAHVIKYDGKFINYYLGDGQSV